MRLLFITMGMLIAVWVSAQTAMSANTQDFSGLWILIDKQPISGPEYLNAMQTRMKVGQDKDSIIIESTYPGADGKDVTSRQVIAMDGRPLTTVGKTSKRKYVRSLSWSSAPDLPQPPPKEGNLSTHKGQTLIITTVFYVPENENEIDFTRVETWSIADGKLVVHKKSIETKSETWEVKGVFEKVNGE